VAARSGQALLQAVRDGFRGRLGDPVRGADGAAYAVVSDRARLVVVPTNPDARHRVGQSVAVTRDASRTLLVRPVDKDRDLGR